MGGKRQRTGVRAVSNTSIQIDFEYKGQRCRERLRITPTPANLKRVEQHRAAICDAIARDTFDYAVSFPDSPRRHLFAEHKGSGYPLEDYLESWLKAIKPHLKASTWDDYRKIVENTLTPAIGRSSLTDLKRSHVKELCQGMEGASNKRLANVQSVLRAALKDAIDDELIESNPLYGWKYEVKEAPKPTDDVDPFSAEEQTAILEHCREPAHRNLFQFAFWTGLRTSELCALQWADVDWLRMTVRISRALTQASDEPEAPKTRRSARDVKLLAPAIEALQAQKALTYLAGKEGVSGFSGGRSVVQSSK